MPPFSEGQNRPNRYSFAMPEELDRHMALRSVALRYRSAFRYHAMLGDSSRDEADDALIGGLVGEADEIVNGPLALAIEFMDIYCRFDLSELEIATFGAGPVEDLIRRATSVEPVNALAAAARSNSVLRSAVATVWIDADSVRSAVWEAFTSHFGES